MIYSGDSELHFNYDSEQDIEIKNWIEDTLQDEYYNLYPYKQISYSIYELLHNLNHIVKDELGEQVNSTNCEQVDIKFNNNMDNTQINESIQIDSEVNQINQVNQSNISSRPILIMIDEPDSNTKLDKICKINNCELQVIYNYKKEKYKKISEALEHCSKLLLNLSENI